MHPSLAKLGHVALVTPDLGRSLRFFRDVIGLEQVAGDGSSVDLRAWGEFEHHSLTLTEGPSSAIDHIAFRASRAQDVGDFTERLAHAGVDVRRVEAGEERGQGEAARFVLPAGGGHPIEIYYDIDKPELPADRRSRLKNNSARMHATGVSPRCIDHVNLWTANPEPVAAFMEEQLGFKTREAIRITGGPLVGTWMSVTSLVHDVAIMADPAGQSGRFHHLAYYLDNFHDVLRAADILREENVAIDLGPGRHGISQALFCYVRDPGSGHRLELFSGGYHIYDPDWEPIVWSESELAEGAVWWGPEYAPGDGSAMDQTTPCFAATPAGMGVAT
jgi:biphenyl-2,3-diol 1,2-dioxygenase